MTAFWLNLLLLPTYDLPCESELDRFPPRELAEQWSWVAWNHRKWCLEWPEHYPAASVTQAEKLSWILWDIAEAHQREGYSRRWKLKKLRERMPPKWWRCPAEIQIVPFALLPRKAP